MSFPAGLRLPKALKRLSERLIDKTAFRAKYLATLDGDTGRRVIGSYPSCVKVLSSFKLDPDLSWRLTDRSAFCAKYLATLEGDFGQHCMRQNFPAQFCHRISSCSLRSRMGSPGTLKLNNSTKIPALGLGTFLGSDTDLTALKNAVLKALEVGYRHVDTASGYGTEAAIGEALKEAFARGLVKREDVYITTKLAPSQLATHSIIPAAQASLSNLQLEYVDLYLIHWPQRMKPDVKFGSTNKDDYLPTDVEATWEQMEKLVELGLTKSIGVSNFNIKVLKEYLAIAKIPPAVNQIELHPFWQQDKVRAFCNEKNIHVTAWSPLGAPGTNYGSMGIIDSPVMQEIAKKHGKSMPQVALRWLYEIGCSAVPKSTTPKRIADNFDIWDFSLTEEDHQKIKTFPQFSICDGPAFPMFKGSPWPNFAAFWDHED